jgi:hypothetical protein
MVGRSNQPHGGGRTRRPRNMALVALAARSTVIALLPSQAGAVPLGAGSGIQDSAPRFLRPQPAPHTRSARLVTPANPLKRAFHRTASPKAAPRPAPQSTAATAADEGVNGVFARGATVTYAVTVGNSSASISAPLLAAAVGG